MKKRLRKKLRTAEFTVYGAPLSVVLNNPDDFDTIVTKLDDELQLLGGMLCDGYADGNSVEFFVELGTLPEEPGHRLETIVARIKTMSEVKSVTVGELIDSAVGEAGF